jgi:hypothetical protein
MSSRTKALIRAWLILASSLTVLVCTAASCGPKTAARDKPHCAFADPEFMTAFRVCTIAAEYYAANHEWPTNKTQLGRQWRKMLAAETNATPEQLESPDYFDEFTLLDLGRKRKNLAVHYIISIDANTFNHRIILKPGTTTDEIVRTASYWHEPIDR